VFFSWDLEGRSKEDGEQNNDAVRNNTEKLKWDDSLVLLCFEKLLLLFSSTPLFSFSSTLRSPFQVGLVWKIITPSKPQLQLKQLQCRIQKTWFFSNS